jgi:hypothetical protein
MLLAGIPLRGISLANRLHGWLSVVYQRRSKGQGGQAVTGLRLPVPIYNVRAASVRQL